MRLALALVAVVSVGGCQKSAGKPKDAGVASDASGGDTPPPPPCTTTAGSTVHARKIGKANDAAMLATSPPGDSRLFVVEQAGAIRIFAGESKRATAFLDLGPDGAHKVLAGGEQGLLGLAFHPRYATNRVFFVFYTATNPVPGGDPYVDVVERYTASAADPDVAEPSSGTIILSIPDFASNHNGGMIEFGSDGFLYIGTGDGGGAGDPRRNAQNPNALLGKFLRLDVDQPANGKSYGIPTGNPFANAGGAPEVWMLGLRNPWRWSFDRATGDLWIGDVGQYTTEEVDVLKAGAQAGKNLGWSMYEGNTCCLSKNDKCGQTTPFQPCEPMGKTTALDVRSHQTAGWNAIIGGQVYRGSCYPELTGWYFYTDNGKHGLSKARMNSDGTLEIVDLPGSWPTSPASIHADSRGELFETTTDGSIYAIEAGP